jgi:hypothetical protein
MADGFEEAGRRVAPGFAGLILLEATRQAYARVRPRGAAATVPATPVLQPAPATRGGALAPHDERR